MANLVAGDSCTAEKCTGGGSSEDRRASEDSEDGESFQARVGVSASDESKRAEAKEAKAGSKAKGPRRSGSKRETRPGSKVQSAFAVGADCEPPSRHGRGEQASQTEVAEVIDESVPTVP